MGSKGSQTTQAVAQNQSYTADPRVSAAAGQALTGAQNAASQPFQMPVAPVAGFNANQQQAFGDVANAQGMAQPYYNQAQTDFQAGSTPISQGQINSYYNPMAQNVTNQLQNIYGQQNSQNQGMLTSQAGGVGADRISVGMGNLANQQGLASGQIYSQLYQQALQAAQQQQQSTMQAGSNMAGLGTTAQNTALTGAGALGNAGLQQQQQTQAQLNAPYQNQLAQIAYQFQTPQYLAGIAGGLAPALGGTTLGNQNSVTTPPTPSALSQGLGIATAGAGLYGAANSGKGSGSPSSYMDIGGYQMPQYAEGGEVEDQGPAIPGMHLPKGGATAEPIPMISMPMGAGHSGPLTGGMSFPTPQQSSGQGETVGGDIGSVLKTAASVLPFFLDRGGSVPHYDDGGDVDWGELSTGFPTPKAEPSGLNFRDRFKGAPYAPNPPDTEFTNPSAIPAGKVPLPTPYPGPGKLGADTGNAIRIDPPGKPAAEDEEDAVPAKASPTAYRLPGPAHTAAASPYMMPQAQQPYPDSLKRDWGQNAARSPWMALVKAGATMAATPGPLGVSLGKGMLAGVGGLEGQRKELRSEQELNDKAQTLYQNAQVHLDKYTKMTPFEQGSLTARNKEIDQAGETSSATAHFKPAEVNAAIKAVNDKVENIGKRPEELQQLYALELARRKALRLGQQGAVPPAAATPTGAGSSKETAMPDPGEGKREVGKWYIGPTGKPQPWNG